MTLRRIPVVAADGKKIILVIKGIYPDGIDGEFIKESIPVDSIVAIEECPDDVVPRATFGWKPESMGGIPLSDQSDSDPHRPLPHRPLH